MSDQEKFNEVLSTFRDLADTKKGWLCGNPKLALHVAQVVSMEDDEWCDFIAWLTIQLAAALAERDAEREKREKAEAAAAEYRIFIHAETKCNTRGHTGLYDPAWCEKCIILAKDNPGQPILDELERLRKQAPWIKHLRTCEVYNGKKSCTCGLDEARK